MTVLEVRRVREGAQLPTYATEGSAGLDLRAAIESPLVVVPGARTAIPTGLAVAIPAGFEGQVRARSGLALKHGIALVNAPGTIDSDYRGEIAVLVINHGDAAWTVQPGDRIAQLVLARYERVAVEEVEALGDTGRGSGGFGSTGRA